MKLLRVGALLFLASYAIALLAVSYSIVLTPTIKLKFIVVCEKLDFSVEECLTLYETLK